MSAESWKLTLPCTRAEAEALVDVDFDRAVLVTNEPDPAQPERWQLDAYFEGKPSRDLLRAVARLVPSAREKEPRAKPVPPEDWVTRSQAGLEPLVAGRFYVRTPDHPAPYLGTVPAWGLSPTLTKGTVKRGQSPSRPAPMIDFVIPAGLAFGTGQHDTTRGCLEALDGLKRRGKVFRNILDLGTGTGLLAFAAKRLWPGADVAASDIDPVSIAVVRENARTNGVRGLTLAVADGLADRRLIARAPYDLVIANILAQPLIDMAPSLSAVVSRGGTLVLAGLLAGQAEAVARAYTRRGMRAMSRGEGDWPVLMLQGR